MQLNEQLSLKVIPLMRLVMKLILQISLISLLINTYVISALAKGFTYPEYDNIFVNDLANLLDTESEARIKGYLQEVGTNGTQISLLTIQSLNSYNAGPAIEPFATALFNHWGVGDATRNDGVLILVAHSDRKMRIELGSGYPAFWNREAKDVIDNAFIPYFKKDNYQGGIENGVLETIKTITGEYPSAESGLIASITRFFKYWWNKLGFWLLAIGAPIAAFVMKGLRHIWRMRPRSCRVCQHKMIRLDEQSDDEHIDGGQRLEEYLQSVDYDVWQCQNCNRLDIYRYVSFFTSYETCPQCNYKTVSVNTTVLEEATTSSTGLKQLDYECKQCDFTDTETRTIPRRSSSSSGSGGSSFGGGSSSGGGASGSW